MGFEKATLSINVQLIQFCPESPTTVGSQECVLDTTDQSETFRTKINPKVFDIEFDSFAVGIIEDVLASSSERGSTAILSNI